MLVIEGYCCKLISYLSPWRFLSIGYGIPHIHAINPFFDLGDVTSSYMIEGW